MNLQLGQQRELICIEALIVPELRSVIFFQRPYSDNFYGQQDQKANKRSENLSLNVQYLSTYRRAMLLPLGCYFLPFLPYNPGH